MRVRDVVAPVGVVAVAVMATVGLALLPSAGSDGGPGGAPPAPPRGAGATVPAASPTDPRRADPPATAPPACARFGAYEDAAAAAQRLALAPAADAAAARAYGAALERLRAALPRLPAAIDRWDQAQRRWAAQVRGRDARPPATTSGDARLADGTPFTEAGYVDAMREIQDAVTEGCAACGGGSVASPVPDTWWRH